MEPEKTSALSNTVGLEAFLTDHGVEPAAAYALCMEIGRLAEKLQGGVYSLLDETQLEGEAPYGTPEGGRRLSYKEQILRHLGAIAGADVSVDFLGVDDLCRSGKKSRRQQMTIYRIVRQHPVREALGLHGGVDRDRTKPHDQDVEYLLRTEIKRAIGTNRIQHILDHRYGNAFSDILEDNIVDLWYGYGKALIDKDMRRIAHFAAFCPTLRVALPIGRHHDDPTRWAFFIHRNKAKDVGS